MDHTDPKQNYGAEAWRAPAIPDDAVPLFDECGRVIQLEGRGHGVDYRSHYFRLYQEPHAGRVMLAVSHGGGTQQFDMGHEYSGAALIAAALPSHLRYLYFHSIYAAHRAARAGGVAETEKEYRQAFAEGRLKKRKMPGRNACKIWIEAQASTARALAA